MTYLRGKHESMTQEEKNKRQRELRAANGNSHTKAYEKTVNGFLMRAYRNMKSRVTGVQWRKSHLYSHCGPIPSREDFYKWANSDPDFASLWTPWVESGHDRRLTPSLDRINPSLGYTFDNIRWITHSENSRLGAIKRNAKHKQCTNPESYTTPPSTDGQLSST